MNESATSGARGAAPDIRRLEAVILDMDGVVTDTRRAHEAAWKALFDAYRQERAERGETPYAPFAPEDYREHLDGKPRFDGLRDFLASRGIELPEGEPDDGPEAETVRGLGARKNARFRDWLASRHVDTHDDALALLRGLREAGVKTAVISASRNAQAVLENAGVADLFDARVDGVEMAEAGLPGKPDPAIFLRAAEKLGADPARAAVVEDSLAGVEAGARGGFALVVGVDRSPDGSGTEALESRGAHRAVRDLLALWPGKPPAPRRLDALPSAFDGEDILRSRLCAPRLAVFLDYDGTLTPIVPRPEDAVLSGETREAMRALARHASVAVISGRDLRDVRERVGLPDLVYAGSHGFDISGPDLRKEAERAADFLPALDAAEAELTEALGALEGVQVERKKFSIAVHYRRADAEAAEQAQAAARRAGAREGLRASPGRKIVEVQPDIDWDKGRAVLWLMETLGLDGEDVAALYVGDDVTDEDAFRALARRPRALGVAVRGGEDRGTWAAAALADTEETARLLRRLCDWREEDGQA